MPPSTVLFILLTTHKPPTSASHPANPPTQVLSNTHRTCTNNADHNSSSQHSDSLTPTLIITNTITDTTFSPHSQSLTACDEELKHIQAFLTDPSSLISTPFPVHARLVK